MEHLEERLREGAASPVKSVTNYSARDHFTAVGDRPGHGSCARSGAVRSAGRGIVFALVRSISCIGPFRTMSGSVLQPRGAFHGSLRKRDGLSNMPDGEFQKGVASVARSTC